MTTSAPALPSPINGHQALEWRARLYARRPAAVRRHALRVGARAVVLLAGDVLALLAARWLLASLVGLVAPRAAAQWLAVGPLAAPGDPASLVYAITLFIALALTGSYGRHRSTSAALRLAGAVGLAAIVASAALAALIGVGHALALAGAFGAAVWGALVAMRPVSELFLAHVWPRDRWSAAAVVVADPAGSDSPTARALRAPGGEYSVAATYPPGAQLVSQLRSAISGRDVEAVAVCTALPKPQAREVLELALDAGCQLLYPARALELEGVHPRLAWHSEQAFLEVGPIVLRPGAVILKRVADVIGSAVLLILTAPLMLLIAAAIKLDSRGPVLFVQDRAGIGGRRFRMLKFRTMRDGADGEKPGLAHLNASGDVRLFKIPADPRVTRLGQTLRRWSLDELPQLWNVLRGDMSLVGPRPFFESDFAAYDDHHFRRLDTKPGITGLWQVSGRSDVVDFEEVIILDRQYIERWSFWLDLSILLRTVPAVMRRKGAF